MRHGCGRSGWSFAPRGPMGGPGFMMGFGVRAERDWGRGGRRRRMFDGGELRLVLLALIADQPRHGYDLIREIEEMTGGAYAPSPGVVYPTLTLLDDMALIEEQRAEGARKLFAITDAGRAHLEERREEADALVARLRELGARDQGDAVPVKRAMANLRQVLHHRLDGGADAALGHRIAELIDEAARRIERLD